MQLGQPTIKTMASGDLPTELKFFLYAKESDGAFILVQASIAKDAGAEILLTINISGGSSGG